MRLRQWTAVAIGAICISGTAACGTEHASSDESDASAAASSTHTVSATNDLKLAPAARTWTWGTCRCAFRKDPRTLVTGEYPVDFAGVGKVVRVTAGGIDGAKSLKSQWAVPQAVVQVKMTDIYKGKPSKGGMAYLTYDMPRGKLGQFRSTLPKGTSVGVYADEMSAKPRGYSHMRAGRPSGTQLLLPALQGIAVPGDEGVLYLGSDHIDKGKDLADVMPTKLAIKS